MPERVSHILYCSIFVSLTSLTFRTSTQHTGVCTASITKYFLQHKMCRWNNICSWDMLLLHSLASSIRSCSFSSKMRI